MKEGGAGCMMRHVICRLIVFPDFVYVGSWVGKYKSAIIALCSGKGFLTHIIIFQVTIGRNIITQAARTQFYIFQS